jgi:hypothetical protein
MQLRSNTRPFALFFALLLGLTLVACDSGGGGSSDDGGDLSVEDARQRVAETDNDLAAGTQEFTDGEFAVRMQELFGLGGSTSAAKQTTQSPLGFVLIDGLSAVLQTSNGRLDFAASAGVYDWDAGQQAWADGGASDDIVLNFPISYNAPSNNATFTLAEYTDVAALVDGQSGYLPQRIDASLTVGGTDIFAVDLSDTAFYDGDLNGTQVPRSFLLDVLTAPLAHTFMLDSPSKQNFNFSFEAVRDFGSGSRLLSLVVELSLAEDFDAATSAQAVETVEGELGLGANVTLDYSVDVAGAAALGPNPTVAEINNQFSATLRYQSSAIGNIELDQEMGPVLVYSDGSKDPLAQVFGDTFGSASQAPVPVGTVTQTVRSAIQSAANAVVTIFRP